MKLKDIQEIHEAGLISGEQLQQIMAHFRLEHPRNRFLTILGAIGGVLVLTGVILVISANWDAIPGLVKIAVGALLMAGAHALGWNLRGTKQTHPKLGEVFHFVGAGLFLANIALVGQVYHLTSRTPNALLFWLAGIIPLIWILRSPAIHALALGGSLVWLGMEVFARDGWFYSAYHLSACGIFSVVGVLFYGFGLFAKRGSLALVAPITEKVGLTVLHVGLWPLVADGFEGGTPPNPLLIIVPAVAGLAMAAAATRKVIDLPAQWRVAWLGVLLGWSALAGAWSLLSINEGQDFLFGEMGFGQALAAILLVVGSIIQMRVAEELRASWMVNLAVVTTGFCILVCFFLLVGSMMNTGLIFLVGGAGILGLGYWLEKQRRAMVQRINA